MGGIRRRTCALAGLLLACPLPLAAQSPPAAPSTWQIDASVGVGRIAPADLNARVAYDTAWLDYLRTAQVSQQHDGALRELQDTVPVSVRVARRVGRHWLLGGGFSYFSSREASSASASYRYTVVDPRAQEYQREFAQALDVDPLVLEVRDYLPHGVVGVDVALGSRLRIGGALVAGWAFAECDLTRASMTQGGFYATNRQSDLEMTGQGSGPAAEGWLTGRVALTRRMGVLVEGGFAWHELKTITGSLATTQRIQDGEAAEVELEQVGQADGRWVNQPVTPQSSSATWRGTVPSIGVQGSSFTLSLTGWQFRVGVSLGL